MRLALATCLLLGAGCTLDVGKAPSTYLDPGGDSPADGAAADGAEADPGGGDPGLSDPGPADPGALDPGALDPGALDPGAPDLGAPDPGAPDPGPADLPNADTGGPSCGSHPLPEPAGTPLLAEGFEGGTVGATIVAGTTAWSNVKVDPASSLTFDTAPGGGTPGLAAKMVTEVGEVTGPAPPTASLIRPLASATYPTLYVRARVYISAASGPGAGLLLSVGTGGTPGTSPAAKLMLDANQGGWILRREGPTPAFGTPTNQDPRDVWVSLEMAVCDGVAHAWLDGTSAGSVDLGTAALADVKIEGLPVGLTATPLAVWIDDTRIWID